MTCGTRPRSTGCSTGSAGATVFHAAGVIHPQGHVRELFDVNVGGTQLVLDRARRAGAARFVHVSSNSPFGANARPTDRFDEDSPFNPYMGYGRSKLEAEQLVQRSHDRGDVDDGHRASAVVLRAASSRRARRSSSPRSAAGGSRSSATGTQQRSMAYTGNLVHGLLLARGRRRRARAAYWIADAEPYELRTVLDGVRDRTRGRRVHRVSAAGRTLPALAGVRRRHARPRRSRTGVVTSRRCTCSASCRTRSRATSPGPARSSATSPRSGWSRACGPASAGASSAGSAC